MTALPPAMLQAILDEPGDDGIRLIAADYLDERDDAHGAFIRNTLAGWPHKEGEFCRCAVKPCVWPAWYCGERQRLQIRVDVGGLTWAYNPRPGEIRAGFVSRLSLTLADFTAHAAALFAAAPVETVRLTDREPSPYGEGPSGEPRYWRWFDGSRADGADGFGVDELPSWLWRAYAVACDAEDVTWEHPTRQEAVSLLSAALVSFGRDAARRPQPGTGMVQEAGGVFRRMRPGETPTHVIM